MAMFIKCRQGFGTFLPFKKKKKMCKNSNFIYDKDSGIERGHWNRVRSRSTEGRF